MTLQILSVVGARPQFVKAAVVARALAAHPGIVHRLLHTGQHYDEDMSQVFFEELGLPAPDFYLGVGSGPHGEQTGRMLTGIEKTLLAERPDWTLVYGDTNSTLAGALAAAKLRLPVAHVEAGLRSFNRAMPEELNRILADRAADLLFAPTEEAVRNLTVEGIPAAAIRQVGDVMCDAALQYGEAAGARAGRLAELGLEPNAYILATLHRAENTNDPARLAAILTALGQADLQVLLPLHPRTRAVLNARPELAALAGRLKVIPPVGYLEMLALERAAGLIVTDSGGVQKEAYFARVPCVTVRDETEWVELVDLGWNRLAPPASAESVLAQIRAALEAPLPAEPGGLYGGGRAAERIAAALAEADDRIPSR
ncbi:MAG: UDP-N-acetylglucosamine 2-epimerase (non-hydrolyzing) [Chloroflexi bacterium]|nr:UDP-N-acetylglucosamine 2-epimerase (non-hydrolyzing) [Chloroflexota bacterium]